MASRRAENRKRRRRGCAGKIRHETPESAQRHIDRLRKRDEDPMKMYVCPLCQHWHVAHVVPRSER